MTTPGTLTSRSTAASDAAALALGALLFATAGPAEGQVEAQAEAQAPAQPLGPVIDAPVQPPGGDGAAGLGSPVLTLDQDALFSGSAFGQRVQQELQRDRAALAQENRRIEAELVEEELALTQQRETTEPEEFAELANAFDRKVQQVRETQDGKSILLQQRLERERQTFLAEAGPVIATLVQRRGAYVVLDRSVILLSFEGVDITEEAIAAIDAAIGSGSSEKLAPPAQLSRPNGEGE